MFISFEGLDGSGKTTQVELLSRRLREQGRDVVATREPGGTPLGERVRELLLAGKEMSAWAETALFAAARAELVELVVRPALERGADVICDRYVDSSLAYQGVARGLGVEPVLELNLAAVRGLLPDRTFVLLLDPSQALRRAGGGRDRIERETPEFRRDVDRGFRELAERFPERIVKVDAERPRREIAEFIHGAIRQPS